MLALRGAVLANAPPTYVASVVATANGTGIPPAPTATLSYGRNSSVTVQRTGTNSLSVYFYDDNDLEPTGADWATTTRVPFLNDVSRSTAWMQTSDR